VLLLLLLLHAQGTLVLLHSHCLSTYQPMIANAAANAPKLPPQQRVSQQKQSHWQFLQSSQRAALTKSCPHRELTERCSLLLLILALECST
jgi:hypothetical protein